MAETAVLPREGGFNLSQLSGPIVILLVLAMLVVPLHRQPSHSCLRSISRLASLFWPHLSISIPRQNFLLFRRFC